MQVALSIQAGTISLPLLLRRFSSESRRHDQLDRVIIIVLRNTYFDVPWASSVHETVETRRQLATPALLAARARRAGWRRLTALHPS